MRIGVEIIAKAPIPGWCNTRLACEIGIQQAADLQNTLIKDTVGHVRNLSLPVRIWLGVGDNEYKLAGDFLVPDGAITLTREQDLGKLIVDVYGSKWAEGMDAVILLGADAPHAVSEFLPRAIDLLQSYEVALGPTEDGGVYLIGARSGLIGLWDQVRWGTDQVFNRLVENTIRMEKELKRLPQSFDIDTATDLHRLASLVEKDSSFAPDAARLLQEWKRVQ